MTRSIINLRIAAQMFLAAGLALCASVPAAADVDVDWVHEGLYQVRITNVPDFDQLRDTLPNNGSYYCAPTSAVNWAAYFANHGLPDLPPGPGYWAGSSMYEPATEAIYNMGCAMLTDPNEGTRRDFLYIGLRVWFGLAGDHFNVISLYSDHDWSPTIHDVNVSTMAGAYTMLSVAWCYELCNGTMIVMDGGHAISAVDGARDGDLFRTGIRDPWTDEDDFTRQSPFTTELYDVEHRFVKLVGYDEKRLMSRFPGYGGNGHVGYLVGFSMIRPLFVLTTHPTAPGWILRQQAVLLYGGGIPPIEEWLASDLMAVKSLAIHVDLSSFIYVADGEPGQVFRLDPVSGVSQPIDGPFENPREVMVSRLRDLYVLDGDDLVRVAIDVKPPRMEGRITPPSAMCAMAYDDATDELMLLSPDDQTIHRYLYHFDCDPIVKHIVPQIPLSEKASISWDAARQAIWVVSDASESVFMLVDNGEQLESQEYTHPVLMEPPDEIVAHDGGHIFVSCDGMLYEFELVEKGLELVENPMFPDMHVGKELCISRSSTNYDEELHGGEEWYDVPPDTFAEPTEDCVGDVNDDGTVNVVDLLALLGAWGECPPDEFCHADFDYSGAVGAADLLMLLGAWGPCEPIGACCLWDGTCVDLSANDCALQGESIWFEGESCETFQCPDWPTGACCVEGECVETNTEYECAQLDGKWFEDEDCADFQCPTDYCEAWGECGQHISRVRMGDIDNSSGCDTGYSDYSNLDLASVIPGYVLQIMVLTANYQPDDVCGIWVDWDQDLVFDYPRDFVDSGDLSAGYWFTQIGAPLDAKPGPTRLRLCLVHDEFPFPCGQLGAGEVEDYTILVATESLYCSVFSECDQYISRVQLGDIDNTSDCALGWYGYSDFTYHSTELSVGSETPITITIDYGEEGDQCAVWIDWNRDFDFYDAGEAIALEGTPGPGPYTGTVTPPPDAVVGPTRMRVRSVRDEEPLPCGEQSIGEAEDYTIVVVE